MGRRGILSLVGVCGRRRSAVLLLALAAALGTFAQAPAAHAAYPGQNGMLAFVNSLGGYSKDYALLRVNPDGSGLNELVAPFPDVSINVSPEWSPDGNRVLYERRRGWGGAVYRANADGSGEVMLTPAGVTAGYGTWSPDGTKIAYRRYSNSNAADASLWVMNADGSGQSEIIPDLVGEGKCSAWLSEMDWGTNDRIAFVAACTSGSTAGWRLWTANGSGSDLTPVSGVPEALATSAAGLDWSPDGKKLVLSSWDTQYAPYSQNDCGLTINALDLFTVDVQANTYSKLTTSSAWGGPHEVDPSWSPDGTRIAFAADTYTCDAGITTFHTRRLYTMAAAGGDVRVLTDPQPGTGDGPYGAYTIDTNDGMVDWQPCVPGVTARCTSVARPRNSSPPSIAGAARVGTPLTCGAGAWTGQDSLAFEWRRNGVAIPGATSATYTPTADDLGAAVTCAVTGTGAGGTTTVESAAVSVEEALATTTSAAAGTAPGGTANGGTTPASAAAAARVIGLPSTKACVSRRGLTIHLHAPRGERLRTVSLRIGKRTPVTFTRRLTAPVVLHGLPRGTWKVRVKVTTSAHSYTITRSYRTCVPRRRR